MNCPVCSTPYVEGAGFCDNCGTKLSAPAPVTPPPVPPPAPAPGPAQAATVCPNCHAPINPGQAFCDSCGAKLQGAGAVNPPPVAPVNPPPAPAQLKCPNCGQTNAPNQAFCDNCGQKLGGPPPVVGPGPVVPAQRTRLMVSATGAAFDLTGKTTVLIGRADPVSGVSPDVDLTPHGGDEGGVSRRHAELSFDGNQWQIKDLNSTNGTALNNQRLTPNVAQPLKNGDQVRVGKVALVFQVG